MCLVFDKYFMGTIRDCAFALADGIIDGIVESVKPMNLVDHLERQKRWSEKTFGPGHRTQGVLQHIRKELVEIKEDPIALEEWIDVVILALDGAWRAGHSPKQIADMLLQKQEKNEAREWPDWRTFTEGQPIEHIRGEEENA